MILRNTVSVILFSLLAGCSGEVSDSAANASTSAIPATDTQRNISLEKLQRIEAVLSEEVDAGLRAGFTAAVIHDGEIVYRTAVGMADRENDIPMRENTRFRIASMTKPITTVALMMLVEDGAVSLGDPVSRYIPAFADVQVATSLTVNGNGDIPTEAAAQPITLHQLLTHTAGLGYTFDFQTDLGKLYVANNLYMREGDLASRIDHLAALPLYSQPGGEWYYSYATDVIGRVVEVISGQTLEDFMQERIFAPLGMSDTAFLIDETDLERVAALYSFDKNGVLQRFNDPNLDVDPNEIGYGWMTGGSGLVSTIDDYAQFAMMMLNDGSYNGAQILSPESVRLMLESHVEPDARPDDWKQSGISFGLGGGVLLQPELFSESTAPGQFWWGGYYDTIFAISPTDDVGYIVMAQRDPSQGDRKSRAQELVKTIAYGALE